MGVAFAAARDAGRDGCWGELVLLASMFCPDVTRNEHVLISTMSTLT